MRKLWWMVVLTACGEAETCEEVAAFAPVVEIGTGQHGFLTMPSEPLPAEWGPQGGQHVWISLKASGVQPGHGPSDVPGPDTEMWWTENGPEVLEDGNLHYEGNAYLSGTRYRGDAEESTYSGIQLRIGRIINEDNRADGEFSYRIEDVCGTVLEDSFPLSIAL